MKDTCKFIFGVVWRTFVIWLLVVGMIVGVGCLVIGVLDLIGCIPDEIQAESIEKPADDSSPAGIFQPSITNYQTQSHTDGRPRVETEKVPVVWLEDIGSSGVVRLDKGGLVFGGSDVAAAWFVGDLFQEYGVPDGAVAVLEYRINSDPECGDEVYVIGYQETVEEIDE